VAAKKSSNAARTSVVNDMDLGRWQDYDDVITDSLWLIDRRDNSGVHTAGYWGNFVPQIPNQMLKRYTRKGEWALDPFLGCGTTLIETQRLGRSGLGIELQEGVAERARELIAAEPNGHGTVADVVVGDSAEIELGDELRRLGQESVQLVILHPPYFDIIKFSDDQRDLSNAGSLDTFLDQFTTVVRKATAVLDRGRYLVLVIGDKYAQGEWIPLGFRAMNAVIEQGYRLKSTIVKNFDETAAKRNQRSLWRYRALVGGFYVFKHEYVFVLQKK
jgi:DNA modification methylase